MAPTPKTRRHGSPCAKSWDDAWIDKVNETELTFGRTICGAKTPKGTPCTLPPNHENGRCKFHGGFDCTGAQPGNRNAVIHGLYARGLQQCGEHCPMWGHCPVADDELKRIPFDNRPQCPYETTQFQLALTDAEERLTRTNGRDQFDRHIAHQAALLQVMVNRAAAALSVSSFTDITTVKSEKHTSETAKMSAALTAFNRLSAEYRRYLALLENKYAVNRTHQEQRDDIRRRRCDAELTPEAHDNLHRTPIPGKAIAEEHLNAARETIGYLRKYRDERDNLPKKANPAYLERDICQYENKIRNIYIKAFDLYPQLRDAIREDPAHEPDLFPCGEATPAENPESSRSEALP